MNDKPSHTETPVEAREGASSKSRRWQTRRLIRLCSKELREILRDRRTIITLVLMPLLVYPILTLTFNSFLLNSFQQDSKIEPIIGFESESEFLVFREWYAAWANELDVSYTLDPESNEPKVKYVEGADVRRRVNNGIIDLGVVINPANFDSRPKPGPDRINVDLYHREGSIAGEAAAEFMKVRLDALNLEFDKKLLRTGLPTRTNTVAMKQEAGAAFSFASFIPLMLILMTITGAVYPAIDLTAGERERGTMEALIAAPIPRIGLLLAKYVAVLMVAILTATANLFAMSITLLNSPLGGLLFGDDGFSWTVMAEIYSMMILFAAFFSAILLAVTSFARSFKEAQAYLIPLMLVSLGPGILSLMPGMELTPLIAVTPLLNLVLLARDTIQGDVDSLMATVAVASTIIYALAAISFAARIFGTDAILYGSEASWSDLLRRPREVQLRSSVAGALFCLAILFPLQFVAASFASKLAPSGPKLSVELSVPEEVVAEGTSAGGGVSIATLPSGYRLSVGDEVSEGTWRVTADESDRIRLLGDGIPTDDMHLEVLAIGTDELPVSDTKQEIHFTRDELMQGIVVGRNALTIRLAINAALTIALFVGIPFISGRWQRVDPLQGFRLNRASALSYVGGAMMGLSLWPFAHEIVVAGVEVGIGAVDDKFEMVERLVSEFRTINPLIIVLALAITPALCEEFFFRGFLMHAFLRSMSPAKAIVLSAILFGAFHLIGTSVLAPERFLPSAFLGLFLGWVCYRTGSVLPGMALHAVHNGLLLMMSYYQQELIDLKWLDEESLHLPTLWLVSAAITSAAGLAVVWFGSKRKSS